MTGVVKRKVYKLIVRSAGGSDTDKKTGGDGGDKIENVKFFTGSDQSR